MGSKHTALCEAVKDALNDGTFSELFTAHRSNAPINELSNAGDLSVVVFPGARASIEQGRRASERSYVVGVLIAEQIDDATADNRMAREDALIGLAEEIEAAMERTAYEVDGVAMVWQQQETEGSGVEPLEIDELAYGTFASVVSSIYVAVT